MRDYYQLHSCYTEEGLLTKGRKHGTYRPALMTLVKSNPADLIKSTTQEAFASLRNEEDVMKALKILTRLRGIGPATASLLLSVCSPDEVPFFSDELFRWTHWDTSHVHGAGQARATTQTSSPGKTDFGWQRSIKYNVTEYKEILASVEAVRKRLGVKAVDAEKVAYLLGKEKVDLDLSTDNGKDAKVVVDQKIEANKIKDRKIAVAAAKAAAAMDSEKTADDFLIVPISETEGGGKADTKKGESRKGPNDGAGAIRRRELKDAEKKTMKRKAREEQPLAEGTRRSTRRKV